MVAHLRQEAPPIRISNVVCELHRIHRHEAFIVLEVPPDGLLAPNLPRRDWEGGEVVRQQEKVLQLRLGELVLVVDDSEDAAGDLDFEVESAALVEDAVFHGAAEEDLNAGAVGVDHGVCAHDRSGRELAEGAVDGLVAHADELGVLGEHLGFAWLLCERSVCKWPEQFR